MVNRTKNSSRAGYHFCEHAEGSLGEAVELLLMGRQTQPHVDPQLHRDLHALVLVHWILGGGKGEVTNQFINQSINQSIDMLWNCKW